MGPVIVSGGSGFLGRHLIQKLTERQVPVWVLTSPGHRRGEELGSLPGVRVLDVDPERWEDSVPALPREAEAFFCLGWSGVAPQARNDFELQFSNLAPTANLLRLAAAAGARRFILPGSTMEYAGWDGLINAAAPPSPSNLYGAAKVAARYLCQALAEELGIPFIYTVITGIYSADRRDSNVIHYAITSLLRGEKPSFTALEQPWDYVHIDDVTEALWAVAVRGKDGGFYPIGHGDNWPLANYIRIIRDLIDPAAPLGIGEIPYKGGRVPSSCVDLAPLREELGFTPQISFEQGIREVIARIAGERNE